MRSTRFRIAAFAATASLFAPIAAQAASLTVLFNNDGESQLLERTIAGRQYGGASRFITLLEAQRADAQAAGRDVLTIAAGDNFLASPIFNSSLAPNTGPFLDARVLSAAQYDAILIGNHEFDFGPQVLADFIGETSGTGPFVTANLDFGGESSLQALVGSGRIAPSTIVTRGGEQYAIVGATTEELPFISSPGGVVTNPVVAAVQAEIDRLTGLGINKIILTSQLQSAQVDVSVISQLRGVDLVVSGGYNPLLTNDLPQGGRDVYGQIVFGPYPLTQFNPAVPAPATPGNPGPGFSGPAIVDADNRAVPVVSTSGDYEYLGRFDVEFDAAGNLTGINTTPASRPILIDDTIARNATIESTVIAPAQAVIAALAANIIGTTDVPLLGVRGEVRSRETNLGNLITDAFIFNAQQAALSDPSLLSGNPIVAIQNGGGIRGNLTAAAGNVTELGTFTALPFSNFLGVFKNVTPEQLKGILEYSVAEVGGGRFAQVGGLNFTYDPTRAIGDRVLEIEFEDGTNVYRIGTGFIYQGLLDFATIDFTANGGDGYPFAALGFTGFDELPITYQQALFNFISSPAGLNGIVSGADYPVAGEGRIRVGDAVLVAEPGAFALALLGFGGLMLLRRRRTA